MDRPITSSSSHKRFDHRALLIGAACGAALTAAGFTFGPVATATAGQWLASLQGMAQTAQVAETASTTAPVPVQLAKLAVPEFSDPIDPQALAAALAPPRIERTMAVARGDTLMDLLLRAGAQRGDAHNAIQALKQHYDPRRLRPGQEITLVFNDAGVEAEPMLANVELAADVDRRVVASRGDDDGFSAQEIARELEARPQRAAGRIDDSLYLAATRALVPDKVVIELIRLYSFDIDFQRDIQPGDDFELYYEGLADETGKIVKQGPIQFARLQVGGKSLPLYRFETADGEVDYYNAKGESVRKALMRTPIDGARLSSRFGMRKHPILGYSRKHTGIDFAAPSGTPIMAAGKGTIEYAGRKGGYGKYIRIRHNGEYKTAYAHMSKFARGVGKGKRVHQGQIIGYVGTTGRSTGPHLHYEVHSGGKQINPLGLKLPTGRTLKGKELAQFQGMRVALDSHIQQQPLATQVAQKSTQ
ncbi:MAG: peptidoglycan DD-metalloendopeptidase family protein [Alphaproteobacteria bacterium]